MSKAFSQQEKVLIRKQLLEQGYKLFSTYGLKKTNIEEIAKATGISKGAFYGFYDSKEALFLEVIEQAENHVRQQILTTIDQPEGPARARLFSVLKKAYSLFREIPILQFITGSDYAIIFRRIPVAKLQTHLANDRIFLDELFTHCQNAGIPIQIPPERMVELLYPLALSIIHEDELNQVGIRNNIDPLLELVAAYCLGEVRLQFQGEGKLA